MGKFIFQQLVNLPGQRKIFLRQTTSVMCRQLNSQAGVSGQELGMVVVALCHLAHFEQELQGRFEAVKLPLLMEADLVGVQVPVVQGLKLLLDFIQAESFNWHGQSFFERGQPAQAKPSPKPLPMSGHEKGSFQTALHPIERRRNRSTAPRKNQAPQ